jgi:hypothetical protein
MAVVNFPIEFFQLSVGGRRSPAVALGSVLGGTSPYSACQIVGEIYCAGPGNNKSITALIVADESPLPNPVLTSADSAVVFVRMALVGPLIDGLRHGNDSQGHAVTGHWNSEDVEETSIVANGSSAFSSSVSSHPSPTPPTIVDPRLTRSHPDRSIVAPNSILGPHTIVSPDSIPDPNS